MSPRWCFCYPHYKAVKQLEKLLVYYSQWPVPVLQHLQLLIVDDGSPQEDQELLKLLLIRMRQKQRALQVRIFHIVLDVPWNMSECNNIAFRFAPSQSWVLRTDLDHVIPLRTFRYLLKVSKRWSTQQYFTFRRRHMNCETWKPTTEEIGRHVNTQAVFRETYLALRGYDEAFAGHYGYEDLDFRRRLKQHGVVETPLSAFVDVLLQAATPHMNRDVKRNRQLLQYREAYQPPLYTLQNFSVPFMELCVPTFRSYPTRSCLPGVYGVMIVKNDAPVVGTWFALQAHHYEHIHVLDGTTEPQARCFLRETCQKYSHVTYQHEAELAEPVKRPWDHDLRRPGLQFLRKKFGRGLWIAILHPDELFIEDFHMAIHKAWSEQADHILCRVLEVLPAREEQARFLAFPQASVFHLLQTFWNKDTSHHQKHNHLETRFFRDGPHVDYMVGTHRKAAPHGLKKAASYQPYYIHEKLFDVRQKYTSYEHNSRKDHFDGHTVGLSFDIASAFSEAYGSFKARGTLGGLPSRISPSQTPHWPEGFLYPIHIRPVPSKLTLYTSWKQNYITPQTGEMILIGTDYFSWHEWWSLKTQHPQPLAQGASVFVVVLHTRSEKLHSKALTTQLLDEAYRFIIDDRTQPPVELTNTWFTILPCHIGI